MKSIQLTGILILIFSLANLHAQSVGIGTATPHASAQLDISSNTKGTLITTMTTTQRRAIVSPATGLLVFDIDKKTIYMFDGTRWLPFLFSTTETNPPSYFQPPVISTDANFGYKVDIYGDYAIIGAPQAIPAGFGNVRCGEAYIFFRNNGVWQQQDILVPADGLDDDHFGASVSINESFAVVGAWGDDIGANSGQGSVYLFSRVGEDWSQQSKITASDGLASDFFGHSVDISTSNTLVIGAYGDNVGANLNQGSAYIYQGSAGLGGFIWALDAKLTASDGAQDDFFGASVAIFSNTVVVGAWGDDVGLNADQGSAYVFWKFTNQAGWTTGQAFIQKLTSSDGESLDYFGISVDLTQSVLVVGASGDDVDGNSDQGSAYIFVDNNAGVPNYGPGARTIAPDGAPSDNFGISVSLGTGSLAIGAYRADDGGGVANKGSVYIFKNPSFFGIYPSVFYRKLTDETGQANGYFGYSVSLFNYELIVGAYGKNSTNGQIAFLNIE